MLRLSPGGNVFRRIMEAAAFGPWGVVMLSMWDLGSVRPARKHRPWWTFKGCSPASCRVHAKTPALGQVGTTERAQ